MTKSLQDWLIINKMAISESEINGSDIVTVDGVGDFLYIHPVDKKIIDEDFGFILSDEEFDLLEDGKVKYILFEFGKQFYYSAVKKDKNRYNEIIYKPEFNDFRYLGKCTEEPAFDFAHLGVHSEYEMLNGSGSCELWAKKAAFVGAKYLGICDKNTLAGTMSFQAMCEKKGIKSIIGETVTVAVNYDANEEHQETFEIKLYVLEYVGWKNLLLINKAINVDYPKYIPEEELLKLGKGLCCVIPKESEMNYRRKDSIKVLKIIKAYKQAFDKLYYQIDTCSFVSDTLYKSHLSSIDEYLCLYRKHIEPILINDSYYLDKDEHDVKLMLNKVSGKAYPESENQYFKTIQDTLESYSEWIDRVEPLKDVILEGFQNASELCSGIEFRINTGERKLPRFEVDDVEELFFEEVEKGFQQHFGHLSAKQQEPYLKQLETECEIIVPNGLCNYFMILWDIIRWCHENNIATGPGRGSVCGSLIAYCLNITQVDPLKYGLMFSRFLNKTRVEIERVWELTLENGKKFRVKKGVKLPLSNGKEIDIDGDLDLSVIDIDIDKLKSISIA